MASNVSTADIQDSDAASSKANAETKVKCKTKYLLALFSARGEKVDFQSYPSNPTSTQCTEVAACSFDDETPTLLTTTRDLVAYTLKDGVIRVLELNYAATGLYQPHQGHILDLSFSQTSKPQLASSATDSLLLIASLQVELSPEQKLLIKATQVIGIRRNYGMMFTKVVWHPSNANLLATLGSDGSLCVWNTSLFPEAKEGIFNESDLTAACQNLSTDYQDALHVSFSTDGERVVLVSNDGAVTVWAWKEKKQLFGFQPPLDQEAGHAFLFTTSFVDQSNANPIVGDYLVTLSKSQTLMTLAYCPSSSSQPGVLSQIKLENPPAQGFSVSIQPSIPGLLLADPQEPFLYAMRIGLAVKDPKKALTAQDALFLSSTKFYVTKPPVCLSVSSYEPPSDPAPASPDSQAAASSQKLLCTFIHSGGVTQAEIIPSNFRSNEKPAATDKLVKPNPRSTTPPTPSKVPSSNPKTSAISPPVPKAIGVAAVNDDQQSQHSLYDGVAGVQGQAAEKKISVQLHDISNKISSVRKEVVEGVRKDILPSLELQIEKSVESVMTKKINQQIKAAIQSQFDLSAPVFIRTISENVSKNVLQNIANQPRGMSGDLSPQAFGVISSLTKAALSDMSAAITSNLTQTVSSTIDLKLQESQQSMNEQFGSLQAKLRGDTQDLLAFAMGNMTQETRKFVAAEVTKINQSLEQIRSSVQTIHDQMKVLRQIGPKDPQQQVSELVSSGKYVEAFHLATSLADEAFLVNVCQDCKEDDVCRALQTDQAVLLALIQQLCFHLEEEIELRICWLAEALMAIQIDDPVVTMNGVSVLNDALAALLGISEASQKSHKRMITRARKMIEEHLKRMSPTEPSS